MKFAGRRAPLRRDVFDYRGRWTGAHQIKQAFQIDARTFGDEFNRAVGTIAYPADESQFRRAALREPAKVDALHDAGDDAGKANGS